MSALEVEPLDPFDRTSFDSWHAVYLAAETWGREESATPWQLEEMRVLLQERGIRRRSAGFVGRLDGETVCVGRVGTPLLDNLERAELSVHTRPDARREGHATTMLARLEQVAAARGRRILAAEAAWPYAAGPGGAGEPGPAFAARHGYALAVSEVQRHLSLPVDDAALASLAAAAAPHHTSYTLRSFPGPVPDHLVAGWAALAATLITEAPTGDLEVEPETADVAAVREGERVLERQGRTKYHTVALDLGGAVAAYTELVTTVHEPERAYQWGTLVHRAHRGRRLGLAVKVANLRLLQRERPDLARVLTWNAEENGPMVAVNDRLGFRPVARSGELEKRLG